MNSIIWILRKTKTEIKIVLITLAVLIFLPAVAVVVAAASAAQVVSDALATVNPVTHIVSIFNPNGEVVRELELSTVWPANGYVSEEWGTLSIERILMGLSRHTGIDIANERGQTGAPITPFMEGTVITVHDPIAGDCGTYVELSHGNGITSIYCHMLSTNTTKGAVVKPGDVIGYVGQSGAATGPHVHFQINVYGISVNPRTFMVGEPLGTVFP